MAKTESITVYNFSELSDKAKERAKQDDAQAFGFAHGDEYLESLKKLAEHFGGKLKNYEIDWFASSHSSATFEMPDDLSREDIAAKLAELGSYNPETLKGTGECKLTGYCADEDAIDGFRIAFQGGESDIESLMQSAFDSWLTAAQADCEGYYEDEYFGETCDANDLMFTADGRIWRKQ